MKDTQRFLLSAFKKVKNEEDIHGNGTSVMGGYFISGIDKIGYHKENGRMNICKNDEDLRELLASEILSVIGVPHADIIPIYDEKNKRNGCLSVDILRKDEMFVVGQPQYYGFHTVRDFIERDVNWISRHPNITHEVIKEREKYMAQYLYVSALLSNTDIKDDNRENIYNQKTGKYRNAEYYDAGRAFYIEEQNGFFNGKNSEKLLSELYKDYASEIFPLAQRTEEKLTEENISKIMSDSIYNGFDKKIREDITKTLNSRIKLITTYNHNILQYGMAELPTITTKSIREKTQTGDITIRDKVNSFISNLRSKIRERSTEDDHSESKGIFPSF